MADPLHANYMQANDSRDVALALPAHYNGQLPDVHMGLKGDVRWRPAAEKDAHSGPSLVLC